MAARPDLVTTCLSPARGGSGGLGAEYAGWNVVWSLDVMGTAAQRQGIGKTYEFVPVCTTDGSDITEVKRNIRVSLSSQSIHDVPFGSDW